MNSTVAELGEFLYSGLFDSASEAKLADRLVRAPDASCAACDCQNEIGWTAVLLAKSPFDSDSGGYLGCATRLDNSESHVSLP